MCTSAKTKSLSELSNKKLTLVIDTSCDQLVCGLGLPGASPVVLASRDTYCRRKANVELTTKILNVVREAHCDLTEIRQIVVGCGPGSFTGVRIGIATAKGLACALGVPLYGVSTLDAVAYNAWLAGIRGNLCVVGDAMRHEIYPATYVLEDDCIAKQEQAQHVLSLDEFLSQPEAAPSHQGPAPSKQLEVNPLTNYEAAPVIQQGTHPLTQQGASSSQYAGDALFKFGADFEAAGYTKWLDEKLWNPTTQGFLAAVASAIEQQSGNPGLVLPIYTRLSDAEEQERLRMGSAQPNLETGCAEKLANRHKMLRPMRLSDAQSAIELIKRSYPDDTHTLPSLEQVIEEISRREYLYWVAFDQEKMIGLAGGRLIGTSFEILEVCVDTTYRRARIAQDLLVRIAYDAAQLGAATLELEVAQANIPAQKLYEKLGFVAVGKRAHYYPNGDTALLLDAQLPLAYKNPHEQSVGFGEQEFVVDAVQELEKVPGKGESAVASAQNAPKDPTTYRGAGIAQNSHEEHKRIATAQPLLLAIETSCDETAMSIMDGQGNLLSNVVSTQIDFHARFGGVVPEIASRKHTEALVGVYQEACEEAASALGVATLSATDLEAVGVTYGPGLVGALVVGVAFAKGLALGAHLKLLAVNHLEGHIMANLLIDSHLEPPFVASLVSGGHTMLVYVRSWDSYEVLGETIDDAVGEAFDKVSKALGLGYPGGPIISRLAQDGDPKAIDFPRALLHSHDYRFSLSGLKTSVLTYLQKQERMGKPINAHNVAASFQAAVVDVLVAKALAACKECGVSKFCLGGGVAANPELRRAITQKMRENNIEVYIPDPAACTDNAAMIALVARKQLEEGKVADFTLDANPNLSL